VTEGSGPALSRDGSVFVLSLGEGENRFAREFLDGIVAALDEIEAYDGPAALVTVGSNRFYCNGYDLEWLATVDVEARRSFIADQQALLARLLLFPVATVAAISGHAYGAGALLALAHDWRVMREDRGYLCLPEIDAGIPLRRGMVALLQARLEAAAVRDAVLTGRRFAAARALADGWVDELAPGEALLDTACERAETLAGKSRPAMAALKQGLYGEVAALLGGSRPAAGATSSSPRPLPAARGSP
jgi:enoyl-CoA hydratase/carnithine racemase